MLLHRNQRGLLLLQTHHTSHSAQYSRCCHPCLTAVRTLQLHAPAACPAHSTCSAVVSSSSSSSTWHGRPVSHTAGQHWPRHAAHTALHAARRAAAAADDDAADGQGQDHRPRSQSSGRSETGSRGRNSTSKGGTSHSNAAYTSRSRSSSARDSKPDKNNLAGPAGISSRDSSRSSSSHSSSSARDSKRRKNDFAASEGSSSSSDSSSSSRNSKQSRHSADGNDGLPAAGSSIHKLQGGGSSSTDRRKSVPSSSKATGDRITPAQLTRHIKEAARPQELLSLLQQHGAQLNDIHASALFMSLKQMSLQQRGLTQQPAVQQLLKHMQQLCATEAFRAQCGTRQAANIIYASSFLRWQPAIDLLLPGLVAKSHEATPQAISNTVLAVAKMGQQVPQPQLQQLLAALVSKLPEAKPQEIANTVWAVAKMGQQVSPQQLEQLVAALVSKLHEAEPQNIANTAWAVATMGQQVSQQQLEQLLAALVSKLPEAAPQAIANTVWAVATMGQQVPPKQLQQLLTALVSKLPEANPQNIANSVWAVATMGQQMPPQQLKQLLAALVSKLPQADPQNIANTVWAAAKLRCTPSQLLAVLNSKQHVLEQLLHVMIPQHLANTAYACALLGYSSTSLPTVMLQHAVERLQRPGKQDSFKLQHLSNLAWSAAVLDLQQQLPAVLQLVKACRGQWSGVGAEELRQLYQVHLWLRDCQLPAAGPERLSGCLTAQQLQDCRHSWEQLLQQEVSDAEASRLQVSVFKAICQLLPDSTWQQQPAMEQRTADGAYSIDIVAVTSAGVRLAIEVDGPSHFLLEPARAVGGPTACRNRALAARGYRVVSIPHFEWRALKTPKQQAEYLASKLRGVGCAG